MVPWMSIYGNRIPPPPLRPPPPPPTPPLVLALWGAVAGWLASRTIDPRVVSSNPGRSVTCGCVPGQNTLPLIARVFSDRTLKIVGPFYLVSMPGEVKDPTRVINNVTRSGLTNSSISGAIGYGRVVRTTDCGRRCCMTQTWARTLCDITPSDV